VDEEPRRELPAGVMTISGSAHLVSLPGTARRSGFLTRWRQRTYEDNTGWLGEVLSARGWPGRTLASENDAAAAWLLARHA
jgi:hypothetical protein